MSYSRSLKNHQIHHIRIRLLKRMTTKVRVPIKRGIMSIGSYAMESGCGVPDGSVCFCPCSPTPLGGMREK